MNGSKGRFDIKNLRIKQQNDPIFREKVPTRSTIERWNGFASLTPIWSKTKGKKNAKSMVPNNNHISFNVRIIKVFHDAYLRYGFGGLIPKFGKYQNEK